MADKEFEDYSINVGIINSNEYIFLAQEGDIFEGLKHTIQQFTHNLCVEWKLGESFEEFLKRNPVELQKDDKGIERTPDGLTISQYLENHSYLPHRLKGKIYPFSPYEITLPPSHDYFEFYFVLRLRQTRLQKIDAFFYYQLVNSFQNDLSTFSRFLQLCMREYSNRSFNTKDNTRIKYLTPDKIETVNEWIANKQKQRKEEPVKKIEEPLERINGKIACSADKETIEKYFQQLIRHDVLDTEEVKHILAYSFKVFNKDVEKKRFTPKNVKKGELMKFIHEFFNRHTHSRADANQWIKLILMDCMTTFDRSDSNDKEILEYIKDNWSKLPANYRFR